eukprot:CAMPEP_0196757200 /NCGR_PEP_ID=MMETSP1091-20130531/103531_1 /TAXON_ID=302021 /ORGANISM="Rhodomonas sp., Strain CCMP768" /LENGTH=250 /DNA_ID=CAMNT_0042105959 /DNA_START=145 /DNA_END=897 /DNA_ORIENTATION=+
MAKKGGGTKAKGGFGAAGKPKAKGGFGSALQQKSPKEVDLAAATGVGPPEVEKFELGEGSMFMGGFVIKDESIIDNLVADFKSKSDKHLRGMVSMEGGAMPEVNKEVKDSYEMSYGPADKVPAWQRYLQALGSVMKSYVEEYPMCGAYGKFALVSRSNFQLYPPSGGYKTFHTERTGAQQPEGSRHLVFMTYLNDVSDAGGTEFMHQELTVQPRKGLTLIWPADWTFTHRGVPSPTQEKMIVTGWFNFIG